MRSAMQRARQGHGPTLMEMHVTRSTLDFDIHTVQKENNTNQSDAREHNDPLVRCQHYLQAQGAWDEAWAKQLYTRLSSEVEGTLQDAMRDTLHAIEASQN
jgi:pyruvate dehydrogenase E1 component alpha subunit